MLITILGLVLFEVVNSLDNAVVNSEVLCHIKSPKPRRFFLTWGILISVFIVRGLVPFLIYWTPNRHVPISSLLRSFFHGDPSVQTAVAAQAPVLLMCGGTFLSLLFLYWLLAEEKDLGSALAVWLSKRGDAAFLSTIGALILMVVTLFPTNLLLAAIVGIGMFFIVNGVKEFAESAEHSLTSAESSNLSDWSKVLFLEVIDASFSVDGVVGAFAFTLVVPYILIGNGIGAYIVRRLTLKGSTWIGDFPLLAHGAFYSIGALSLLMILEGFGVHVPEWISPLVTFTLVSFFAAVSYRSYVRKSFQVEYPLHTY